MVYDTQDNTPPRAIFQSEFLDDGEKEHKFAKRCMRLWKDLGKVSATYCRSHRFRVCPRRHVLDKIGSDIIPTECGVLSFIFTVTRYLVVVMAVLFTRYILIEPGTWQYEPRRTRISY